MVSTIFRNKLIKFWKIDVLYIIQIHFSRRMQWCLPYLEISSPFLEDRCIICHSDPFFKENTMVPTVFRNKLTIFER